MSTRKSQQSGLSILTTGRRAPVLSARLGKLKGTARGIDEAISVVSDRRFDLVVAGGLVLLVSILLLRWHIGTETTVVPYHDGSHHVANVANLVSGVRASGLQYFLDFAARANSDAFAYGLFTISSFLVGSGRFAFGLVWVGCLLMISVSAVDHFRQARGLALTLALSLVLFSGLFQARLGGAWDTRVDLLAASFGLAALLRLVTGHWFSAGLLTLSAAFAKGAAITLLVPLVAVGLLLGFVSLRPLQRPSRAGFVKAAVLLVLAWIFAAQIGPQAVSYNLMATGGSTLDDRVRLFVTNAWTFIAMDPWFYVGDLYTNYRGWLFGGVAAVVLIGLPMRFPTRDLRLGLFALVTVAYSTMLLTVSPLHSPVLSIWFLPAFGLAAVLLAGTLARTIPVLINVAVAVLVLIPTLLPLTVQPQAPGGDYQASAADLFSQATQVADFFDAEYAGRSTTVALLVNFLWSDYSVAYNYDVFRVLMQERVRRASLVIDGWELGTRGNDWRPELLSFSGSPEIVFVIQAQPAGIVGGPLARDYVYGFRGQRPDCLISIAQPINARAGGDQQVLRLNPTPDCRQALFAQTGE